MLLIFFYHLFALETLILRGRVFGNLVHQSIVFFFQLRGTLGNMS